MPLYLKLIFGLFIILLMMPVLAEAVKMSWQWWKELFGRKKEEPKKDDRCEIYEPPFIKGVK